MPTSRAPSPFAATPDGRLRACLGRPCRRPGAAATPARAQEQPAQAAPVPGQRPWRRVPRLRLSAPKTWTGWWSPSPARRRTRSASCSTPAAIRATCSTPRIGPAARGHARGGEGSWPPTVRVLAERAPRTLEFLTRDLANTSALGSAYQNQPNDVWLAYGRVTARQTQAERHPAEARTAEGNGRRHPPPPPPAAAAQAGAEPASGTQPRRARLPRRRPHRSWWRSRRRTPAPAPRARRSSAGSWASAPGC